MDGRIHLDIPVVVEGKYDKAHLSGLIDAPIITTDGFGVFSNEERLALIKKLGGRGLVILCDSDGGGRTIRSHLRGMLGGIKTYDLYIPETEGKERRKAHRSKAGLLGVEGIDSDVLRSVFSAFAEAHPELCGGDERDKSTVTAALLYSLGLTGGENSAAKRARVCAALGLPKSMTANAFAEAVSIVSSEEEIRRLAETADGYENA